MVEGRVTGARRQCLGGAFRVWGHLAVAIVLVGCSYFPFGYTKIGEISAQGPKFEGREVKVRGKVADVTKIPFLDIKSYVLRDETGSIVVMAPETLPALGEEIALRATVESVLIVAGKSFGITLRETHRLPVL